MGVRDLLAGGGGGNLGGGMKLPHFILLSSTTWVAPRTGKLRVQLYGAGGSGGVAKTNVNQFIGATGGGGGSFCEKVVDATAGDAFSVTIGARGLGVRYVASDYNSYPGNDGGDTLFTNGTAVNMVAGAGKGGKASVDPEAGLLGGAGGVASGGDTNINGQRGGNIGAIVPSGASMSFATGGGAPGVPFGNAGRGGDIPAFDFSAQGQLNLATGGGGFGGRGGDVITIFNQATTVAASTGGGGSGGDAEDVARSDTGAKGGPVAASIAGYFQSGSTVLHDIDYIPFIYRSRPLAGGNAQGQGMAMISSYVEIENFLFVGGGSGGNAAAATTSVATAQVYWGGSGAAASFTGGAQYTATSGTVVLGGGSGAGAGKNDNINSPDAGAAFAFLEYLS